ncbi:MAG: hypothetical protein C0504_13345 [Candidatus Solibacter sp.]|nr:hypothetical protein [Candidatus Solibacter sp.]
MRSAFCCLFAICLAAQAQSPRQGWWVTEPVRWLQTNVREIDAAIDAKAFAAEAARMNANVLHYNMGGISANYHPQVPFHFASRQLAPGRDLFGDILREAHARKIRVVGRFDFSKTRKEVYDAHPEWFFVKKDGSPVVYNGLHSTCINGGWYREHVFKILDEALTRYDVDGLFFNMFGNQERDYSGVYAGHCHCDACKRRWAAGKGKPFPAEPTPEYRAWISDAAREVGRKIGELIAARRPRAGYFNYMEEFTDGIMSESNTAVSRPLPLWPYASSDNVNRAVNSQPGKASVNLCMQFVDYAWRFATVPANEIALRLWQNIAHGGALAFAINSTFDQQDRQAVETARPIFAFAARNEAFYARQQSAARVILLSQGDMRNYRGLFRLLTELHIPFAVSTNLDWIGKREVDLVVAGRATPELQRVTQAGIPLLVASSSMPPGVAARPVKRWDRAQGYVRVRDKARFPSLDLTSILMLDGPFLELEAAPGPALTFVPPSMFGPPEYIHADMRDTDSPAMVEFADGKAVWLPWDLGSLYFLHSLPPYAGLFGDLAGRLLAGKRQVRTNAHPLVEISLMQQGPRRLLHVINLAGHSQTGYFAPPAFEAISFDVEGSFQSARAIRGGGVLKPERVGGRTKFVLPKLNDYELIVLE